MNLFKFSISFIALGGATWAIFSLQNDAPGWLKGVIYIMALTALIGAIASLPEALRALGESAEIAKGWIEKVSEANRQRSEREAEANRRRSESAAEANRIRLDWQFSKTFDGRVLVKFFAEDGSGVWPASDRAFLLDGVGASTTFSLACKYQQKICYGAFQESNQG
jgi:hypothetical protein